MNIGSLGFVNSMISTSSGESSKLNGSNGFAGVFSAIMQASTQGNVESTGSSASLLSEKDLQELLAFLQTEDILDLDEGLTLLDSTLSSSNTDLLHLVKEYLGLSDEDLHKMLKNLNGLLTEFNKNQTFLKEERVEADVNQLIVNTELKDTDINAVFGIIQAFSTLTVEELKEISTKDFSQVMKVTKLLDLLNQHQDSLAGKQNLTEFIKEINAKIEVLLQNPKNAERMDLLQKTFSPIVAELNSRIGTNIASTNNDTDGQSNALVNSSSIHLQHMSRPEQLSLMLERNGRPVSTEQLIQQFESILARSSFLKSGGTQRLLLKLYPEHLGSLRIELLQKDSTLVARILTTTGAAKEALDSQLNHLKQSFTAQNIQIDRIEISQQMSQNERFFNRESQGERREEQQQKEQEQNQENEQDFTVSFEEAMLNMKV